MIKQILAAFNLGRKKTPLILNPSSVEELPSFATFAHEQLSQWHVATLDVRLFNFTGHKNDYPAITHLYDIFVASPEEFKISSLTAQEVEQMIDDMPIQECEDGSFIVGDSSGKDLETPLIPGKFVGGSVELATYQESVEFINNHLACEVFGTANGSSFYDFSFASEYVVKDRQTWFWREVAHHFPSQPTRVYKHIADPASYFDMYYYNFCYIYLDDKKQHGIVLSGAGAVD